MLRVCVITCTLIVIAQCALPRRYSYQSSQRSRSFRQGRYFRDGPSANLTGPHVCGSKFHKYCCPGWTVPSGGNKCSKALCKSGCGIGLCIRPNLCKCGGNKYGPSCSTKKEQAGCAVRCLNGGTCTGNRCACRPGYEGPYCGQPSCSSRCQNGGRCIAPNRCACKYGFTGSTCQSDYRTGPCFTQIEDNMCKGELTGVVCTKTLCCSTIGQAWGLPCEQCPPEPHPCKRGFIYNSRNNNCQDIDECEAIPNLCVGGQCVNTLGSYTCGCKSGQTRNPRTNQCEDINECSTNPDLCENGRCVNTDSGYFCNCDPGYQLTDDKKACIKQKQSICYKSFVNNSCSDPTEHRLSIKDCCCDVGVGWGTNGICSLCPVRGTKSYTQLCPGKDPSEIFGTSKPEVDYCKMFANPCGQGTCISGRDSYRCRCYEGYKLNADQSRCVDANECERSGLCLNGKCENTIGSFKCICKEGFTLSKDKTYCTDMDECATGGMCPNGECVNMDGSYKCQCKKGFKSSPDQQVCFDIDECTENGAVCLNGVCENQPGSYKCICNEGYTLSSDGAFCLDYNECQKTGMCTHGKCVNMDGTYKCLCDPGFISSNGDKVCLDINECEKDPDVCYNGQCINNQGSFKCECPLGLTLSVDGRTCLDSMVSTCFKSIRGDVCLNPAGALVTISACCCMVNDMKPLGVGWGIPCNPCPKMDSDEYKMYCRNFPPPDRDINECAMYPTICGEHGACENIKNGYRCRCNDGFEVDESGRKCVDIDECETELYCDGGTCHNTAGSYRCQCPLGLIHDKDKNACVDMNECEEENACYNAVCINVPGSFRCECTDPNYSLDSTRRVCVDKRTGKCWLSIKDGQCENSVGAEIHKDECCGSVGKAWGSPCERCPEEDTRCPPGYSFRNGLECKDINECEMIPTLCKGGGRCENIPGSYRCTCPEGKSLDSTGMYCEDLREMTCYSTYSGGRCVSPFPDKYMQKECCCSVGEAWGEDCEPCPGKETEDFKEMCKEPGFMVDMDVNECMKFPTLCTNGKCINTMGSFLCTCNPGFSQTEDEKNCTDIDECRISHHNPCGNGTCINMPGRYTCQCNEGFEAAMMNLMCMDVDECAADPTLCRGGYCINVPGSFACGCPEGHELMPGGKECKDIDECSTTSGICSNGRCENFMGGYECICDPGFKENPLKTACVDIDECRINNGGCKEHCTNTPGSFICDCSEGYVLAPDGKMCVDKDECALEPNICGGGTCHNLMGTYSCRCVGGLMTSTDHKSCIDVDECTLNRNLCTGGRCKNTHGSFVCDCPRGYSSPPGRPGCVDDNECQTESNKCDKNAICYNTEGSYRCRCKPGFTGDGFSCRDINECVEDNGGCDINAGCINIDGSYQCICDDGFEGDGKRCKDVDECSMNTDICQNGQCLNYPGGFSCECDMGFVATEDSRNCEDIDECAMFPNVCVNGECENVFGMFRCICNKGYELDETGGNCTDINECDSKQTCLYGECINRPGSYICQCPPNHVLSPNGNGCIDKRRGTCYTEPPKRGVRGPCTGAVGGEMTRITCCCTVGLGWGETPGFCDACPVPETEEYNKLCVGGPGFRPNNVTVILEDIDECEEIPGICNNGECVNTFGSFKCVCQQGYQLDSSQRRCIDLDECATNVALCGIGTCINTLGSYTCQCPGGHMLTTDNNCMDMRPGACFAQVYNTSAPPYRLQCTDRLSTNLTWKQCCCSLGEGWQVEEDPCKLCPRFKSRAYEFLCGAHQGKVPDPDTGGVMDLNECELMPRLCENGECINTDGSFRCECPDGFTFNTYSHVCEDIDECLIRTPCQGIARCENTIGSFECKCRDGYKLAENKLECVDINECEEVEGVCENGHCNNLQGSFQCLCLSGFTLGRSRKKCIDIDECRTMPNMCRNGTCENIPGSYKCKCFPGFRLTDNGDCYDINECGEDLNLCYNGRCINTIGSFQCDCQPGYMRSSDNRQCVDKDECITMPGLCGNGKCENFAGGFECFCNAGYEPAASGQECIDINECLATPGICYNGRCVNTIGSFACECPKGFELDESGKVCNDMRKGHCYNNFEAGRCLKPRPMNVTRDICCCSRGAGWIPEDRASPCELCPEPDEPSFNKQCSGVGYITIGKTPMDIDECENDPSLCKHGRCINTDGSYRCVCGEGYILDTVNMECIDKDECREQPTICGNGTCKNTMGMFQCSCGDGFRPGPEQKCVDVDECTERSNDCAFRCHNMMGAFVCTCPRGFKLSLDGKHCEDVDECQTKENTCPYACKNLVGGFMCICPDGYRQLGENRCEDIDECATQPGLCANGQCINLQGSYRCRCNPGFGPTKDGKHCYDVREGYCFPTLVDGRCMARGDLVRMKKDMCCCISNAAWGATCEKCPKQGTPEYKLLCPNGPGFDRTGKDIDECARMPGACVNGRCYNTMGSYRCLCNNGYKTDPSGSLCVDIDECNLDPSPCEQHCVNTAGSYICSCEDGYNLHKNQRHCVDIDECELGRDNCDKDCINTPGSFECGCGKGYKKTNGKCEDIDECENPEMCKPGGQCENTQGSFTCTCPRGFKPDANGTKCIDTDECDDELRCQYGCVNIIGSYRCDCPVGFIQHFYWNQCIDENECNQPGRCGTASCFNTAGSFQCTCSGSSVYDPQGRGCVGVGGSGCGGQPCTYGCLPTLQGFMCGCPSGYQRIGQGHCVSTVSPPGSHLPPGVELPHVPAPDGEPNLPPGEGCYNCGLDGESVPLEHPFKGTGGTGQRGAPPRPSHNQRPSNDGYYSDSRGGYDSYNRGYASHNSGYDRSYQPSPPGYQPSPPGYQSDYEYQNDYPYYYDNFGYEHSRLKRDTGEQEAASEASEEQASKIIDVSGPHGKPPAVPTLEPLAKGIINVGGRQANKKVKKPVKKSFNGTAATQIPGSSRHSGQEAPLVLYIGRSHTKPGVELMKLMPALTALKNNEFCWLSKGNKNNIFKLVEHKGVQIVQFAKHVERRGIYNIQVKCRPILGEGELINNKVRLGRERIRLSVHIS